MRTHPTHTRKRVQVFKHFLILNIFLLNIFSQNIYSTADFPEISGDIINPERGWMEPNNGTDGASSYQNQGVSLVWVKFRADDYREKDFDQTFLSRVENTFNTVRANGLKAIPRVLYNHCEKCEDAKLPQVLRHIAQLKPIYYKHADVIAVLDPGFIGSWGEWHTSTNGITEDSSRNVILKALLDMVPKDRMLYVRYPHYKLHYFTGNYATKNSWLDSTKAFNGSDLARIGHLNDCMFSGPQDVGTYDKGIDRKFGLEYIGQESPFLPYGGETCKADNSLTIYESSCANVLKEMPILHITHLNRGFYQEIHQRWRDEKCYDEITRRLGYRYVLESISHTISAPPGGKMNLEFILNNKGFGQLYNPRLLDVVLIGADGKEYRATTNVDPRWWRAGRSTKVSLVMEVPINFPEGSYKLALALPDSYTSLKNNPKYAVRFANTNLWDATRGVNIISDKIKISNTAPGTVYKDQIAFKATSNSNLTPIQNSSAQSIGKSVGLQFKNNLLILNNISKSKEVIKLNIFELSGKKLLQRNIENFGNTNVQVEIPLLEKGVYMVHISHGTDVLLSQKWIF